MSPVPARRSGRQRRRAWEWILLAVAIPVLASACGGRDDDGSPEPSGPSQSASAHEGMDLRLLLGFDEAPVGPVEEGMTFTDSSRRTTPAVAVYPAPAEARLEVVDDADRGRVLRLPSPCSAEDPQCLRGILEVESSVDLDVGDADFSYGAHVKLSASDIRDGANVMQKGYSTGTSGQWKLQVDDKQGQPECVLVGSGTEVAQTVKGDRSVADGRWHALECVRLGHELVVVIDGVPAGRTATTDRLVITNSQPIRVGGKHTKRGSDPFFGQVDDVFLWIR